MTTWFVTRHPGAIEWEVEQRLDVDRHVSHLDTNDVQPGDTVIGSLPVHLAAIVCARGAKYMHLEMDTPRELRGKELTAQEMTLCNAKVEEYQVRRRTTHVD